MSWTEEKVTQLRELWEQGLPTSQIGKVLNFTKNAVVGKAHRIGLERRPSPIKRSILKPDRKKARAPLMPKLSFNLKSDSEFKTISKENNSETKNNFVNTSMVHKKNIGCEWPYGHPSEIDFHFCGKEKQEGKPYCDEHCSRAYVSIEKLKSEDVAA